MRDLTPSLDVLVDEHLSRAARAGSLMRYADMCRADAAAADNPIDAAELLAEALSASRRALEIEAEGA